MPALEILVVNGRPCGSRFTPSWIYEFLRLIVVLDTRPARLIEIDPKRREVREFPVRLRLREETNGHGGDLSGWVGQVSGPPSSALKD